MHLLQIQAGSPQLSAETVPILPVRCRLLKVGQDDGPSRRWHHLQLKAHGGLEAPRRAGAEEDGAGAGGQAGAGFHQRPCGGGGRAAAAKIPHLFVAGGAAVVVGVALGQCRHPLPGVAAADALKLFL